MNDFLANTYARLPITLQSGVGSLLYDAKGSAYIDLTSGIGVSSFGAADPVWLQAVTEQLALLPHVCNLYHCAPRAELAKRLCEMTGMKKVFLSNSGAEANECAIKAARKYSTQRKGANHYSIITLKDSFHGRTLTTLSATGQDCFHTQFQPLTPGFLYAAPNDLEGLRRLVAENAVAGILMECIQGEGGIRVLERGFVQGAYALAQAWDIPLIIDEVQTGNGRTGQLYSYMHYDILPDLVTTAKGLGGGLPIGATLFGEKLQDVFVPGDHGSTFGGNPVCCAGALSILARLDQAFLAQVVEKGAYIRRALTDAPGVRTVSGMGLMIGIETEKSCQRIQKECLEEGVLVLTAKHKLRLLPPLNIPLPLLQTAISVLKRACRGGI